MDNTTLKTYLEARIAEVKKESNFHLRAMEGCAARIEELRTILATIDNLSTEETHKNIQENIGKVSSFKNCFVEPDDVKRANLFLEFMDKCEDETAYGKCRVKMPKLEHYIYRKNRLWNGWADFLKDYNMWVKREGHWKNVLPK